MPHNPQLFVVLLLPHSDNPYGVQTQEKHSTTHAPYGDLLLKQRLKPLLESEGFEVVSAEGEPEMKQRTHASVIGNQDPAVILDFVPEVVAQEADTVYLPGTAWRAVEVVEELERRLNKTVITVNQSTMWMALRAIGVTEPVVGFGKLLTSIPVLAV